MARNTWNDRRSTLFWRELECSGKRSGVGRESGGGPSHSAEPTTEQEPGVGVGTGGDSSRVPADTD